jgi:hypothetical protein
MIRNPKNQKKITKKNDSSVKPKCREVEGIMSA